MYQVIETSLADLSRLYRYKTDQVPMADFHIKGFDNPWLLSSHPWKKGERVLDVGAAYSLFPIHIQAAFGCEVWAADDFGLSSNEPFWQRDDSPHEHIASHPEIKYVLERLGEPKKSSLPASYFDVIYSASVLEHVPANTMAAVWCHMDSLLKPGGEMLHAIDVSFPSNGGLKKTLATILFDAFYALVPGHLREQKCLLTPKAYTRFIYHTLGIHASSGKSLDVLKMVLDPDILTESYGIGLNRIVKDRILDYRYQRSGSLLIRLKKHG